MIITSLKLNDRSYVKIHYSLIYHIIFTSMLTQLVEGFLSGPGNEMVVLINQLYTYPLPATQRTQNINHYANLVLPGCPRATNISVSLSPINPEPPVIRILLTPIAFYPGLLFNYLTNMNRHKKFP